jgi:hypothetical protein
MSFVFSNPECDCEILVIPTSLIAVSSSLCKTRKVRKYRYYESGGILEHTVDQMDYALFAVVECI